MDLAALEKAGLYDPASPRAEERREVLAYLTSLGATVEEMVDAHQRGRLLSLPLDRALRCGRASLTLGQAAAQAGVEEATASRALRAVGLPEPEPEAAIFGPADADTLRVVRAAAGVFDEDVALQIGRVIGSSVSRIAEAEVAAFLLNIASPLAADDAPEIAVAEASAQVATMIPQVTQLIDILHRRHLDLTIRRFSALREGETGYQTFDMGVGFADLVGFTGLSRHLSTRELAAAIVAFETRTADIVTGDGGRLVKLIGDEVMYVAEDVAALCRMTAALLSAFDGDDILPPLRAGLAAGPVLARDGDYFGSVVNLASRAVKIARPGTALVSREVRRRVPEPPPGYRYGSPRPRRVKGWERRVVFHSLRREHAPSRARGAVEAILGSADD